MAFTGSIADRRVLARALNLVARTERRPGSDSFDRLITTSSLLRELIGLPGRYGAPSFNRQLLVADLEEWEGLLRGCRLALDRAVSHLVISSADVEVAQLLLGEILTGRGSVLSDAEGGA